MSNEYGYKMNAGNYEIFCGERKVGTIFPVVYGSNNRPTGQWRIELCGKFIGWKTARTLKSATQKIIRLDKSRGEFPDRMEV